MFHRHSQYVAKNETLFTEGLCGCVKGCRRVGTSFYQAEVKAIEFVNAEDGTVAIEGSRAEGMAWAAKTPEEDDTGNPFAPVLALRHSLDRADDDSRSGGSLGDEVPSAGSSFEDVWDAADANPGEEVDALITDAGESFDDEVSYNTRHTTTLRVGHEPLEVLRRVPMTVLLEKNKDTVKPDADRAAV